MKFAPLIILCVAAFLAPLIGGQVFLGAQVPDGGFLTSLRSPALPMTAHAIIAGLALVSLLALLSQRKVVQLPSPYVLLPLVGVIFSFGLASGASAFRSVSWALWLEWIGMASALVATVAVAGRDKGPRILMWAILAGSGLTAIEGILEYASIRAVDPSWRIFATWVNPNALAGMLLVGVLVGLSLSVAEEERVARLGAAALTLLAGFGLVLTQSKGGLVAFLVGVVVFGVAALVFKVGKRAAGAAIPLALILVLAVGLQFNAKPGAAQPAAVSRMSNAGGTAEQSSGYRQLLWKGAVKMIAENPFGYGLGTYRYESARSGLTPQTQFTHQGFLQIGVEAGILGLLCWLGFAGAWFYTVLRGARRLAPERAILLAGVLAAVLGCGAHNMFDSDWQHFGIGFAFFILLGIGLQLAGDGSSPEMVPKRARTFGLIGGCALILVALVHSALIENLKASALSAAISNDRPGAEGAIAQAITMSPRDGDAFRVRSLVQPEGTQESLRLAAEYAPHTRNLRSYARFLYSTGDLAGAQRVLTEALVRDPNNLPALLLMTRYAAQNEDISGVEKWVSRLIAVESTSYFTVRALPEMVPTETYEGRLLLAENAEAPFAAELKMEALKGLAEYADKTVPQVRAQLKAGGDNYAGETAEDIETKLALAAKAIRELREYYREASADLDALATRVEAALGGPIR